MFWKNKDNKQNNQAGKGDTTRPYNKKAWDKRWNLAFGRPKKSGKSKNPTKSD